MLSDERKLVARELLQFLDKFFEVLGNQIGAIRDTMGGLAGDTMDRLMELSRNTEENMGRARQLLVKRSDEDQKTARLIGEDQFFKSTFAEAIDRDNSDSTGGNLAVDPVFKARDAMRQYMQQVGVLDNKLQASVMEMVGLLSSDDVMVQRLLHVEQGLMMLKSAIAQIVSDFDDSMAIPQLMNILKGLDEGLYARYTIESEKQLHREILRKA
jgi:hypothetical protein